MINFATKVSVTMKVVALALLVLQLPWCIADAEDKPCKKKYFDGNSSFVCECSANYCDTVERHAELKPDEVIEYSSSKDGDRFTKTILAMDNNTADMSEGAELFTVNSSVVYQTILGFGGAFTDSAAMNILNVSSKVQDHLLRSYFSIQGIEYNMGRVPIHSCDFSLSEYSYDDYDGDFGLVNFTLVSEDFDLKIPVIKRAKAMSEWDIRLFASPWSAPAWMKTNGMMHNGFNQGFLIGKPGQKYYKTWANYFIRFLKAYDKLNIPMWGLTVQNEPTAGLIPFYSWQCMAMQPPRMRDFIKMDLGPALHENGYGHIKLMSHDDNLPGIFEDTETVLNDTETKAYTSGIALHWYQDNWPGADYDQLDKIIEHYPDQFILATEACEGYQANAEPVILGSWERGEAYSYDIIQDLNHFVSGWVDWNIALNMQGGPNWAKNEVDCPIIVDAENDAFYKQPMFYHMGHFSKFVPAGSVRIGLHSSANNASQLNSIAFKRPDGTLVTVLLNRGDSEVPFSMHEATQDGYFNSSVPARTIKTYLWKMADPSESFTESSVTSEHPKVTSDGRRVRSGLAWVLVMAWISAFFSLG
ncbi:lysosomal acid glucosylceramidase-like [Patiria miniata]|uniref:Glucosylceramidase n=1 Tax=Patiria miniata TaxID=46514 RepID=A0A913YY26_PATMI|nr:lysosomal acid glucosylceramidase-like [Patiria miniata]